MAQNSQTNKLLGYPADARLLIVNNDDFGMIHSINEAVIHSIKAGLASSCTLMVPCPWALHAMHLLKENPDIPFGVHLTAVSEHDYYRWDPLTPAEKVPTLVDEAGYFYKENRIPEFLQQVSLDELEQEFRAQIEAVLAQNLAPTHVDSHCLIHTRREDIFDMTIALAREYGLAARVSPPSFIDKLQKQGFATSDHDILDSYRIGTGDKPGVYFRLLREFPAGLTEWALHPSQPTEELKAMSPSWDVRQADYEFLMSAEARQIVQEEGIIIIDFKPLQAMWQAHALD